MDPKEKCAHNEEEKQEGATSVNEDKEEDGKCNHTDGESETSQAPPGDSTNCVCKPNLERQGTTTRASVSVSEIEHSNHKANETMEMQDPEDDRGDKDEEVEYNDDDGESRVILASSGDDIKNEGAPNQDNQGLTGGDNGITSEVEKCSHIQPEVLSMKSPEEKDIGRSQPSDQGTSGKSSSGSGSKDQCRISDPRTSGRIRKDPVTRGNDFLWTKDLRPPIQHH
jgi:hypothetical protein